MSSMVMLAGSSIAGMPATARPCEPPKLAAYASRSIRSRTGSTWEERRGRVQEPAPLVGWAGERWETLLGWRALGDPEE